MKTELLKWIVPVVALLGAGVTWVLVIIAALEVSKVVLKTLEQIVDLAAMS